MLAAEAGFCEVSASFTLLRVLLANRPAGLSGQFRLGPGERCGQNAHP